MKSFVAIILTLITLVSNVQAFEKTWEIGNEDVYSSTYVKTEHSSSLILAEAGSHVVLFGHQAEAFFLQAKGEETVGYCTARFGPYNYSSSSSISKSWSGTVLESSTVFTIGIVPVTVSGTVGANASINLSVGIKHIHAVSSVAGTGGASASAGIPGWKAGLEVAFDPILGGTIDALSNKTGTFTVEALKVQLKVFVDYLFGAGHYEREIATYGPIVSEKMDIWEN